MSRRLIVEADGGSRGNPGPAAYGAVVRDADTGRVVAERSEAIGDTTNNVAEYRGLIAGLEAATEVDPTALLDVRLDSKLIVEQMSGRWKIKDPNLRTLAFRARDVASGERVRYTWVPREQNKAADTLVNRALDIALGKRPAVDAFEPAVAPKFLPGWAPDLGAPTVTLLVRHGATEDTLAKLFSGIGGANPPLAPVGVLQAQSVAAELAARGVVDRVVTSPMLRAQQTAEFIAQATGVRDIEVIDDLAECHFGEWEGRTFGEVARQWPDELAEWLSSTAIAPPGGESFDDHRRRIDRARRLVLGEYKGERAAVVAHVTPIKMMVSLALDTPARCLYSMELLPCSLTTIAWWQDGNKSMQGFAESGHLHDLAHRST